MTNPTLTPAILADDDKLHAVIDTLLTGEQRYWKLNREILRLQLRHQELASEDAFSVHLEVEQVLEERHAWELALVVRWAFGQGRGSRG